MARILRCEVEKAETEARRKPLAAAEDGNNLIGSVVGGIVGVGVG